MTSRSFLLASILTLTSLGATALAQEPEPRHVMPVHIDTGVPGLEAESWDGRIMISNCFFNHDPTKFGWVACVFRPENLVTNAAGVPDFSQGAFSDGKGSDVGGVPLEFDGAPNTGMGAHQTIALCKRPGPATNPYASDVDGTPDPNGAYVTYAATAYVPYVNPPNNAPPSIGIRHAQFVVSSPSTPSASIASCAMLDAFTPLVTVAGKNVLGIEATVTADGQLIVFQGNPKNDGSIDVLMYTYNQNPDSVTGWSVPKCVVQMPYDDAGTIVGGMIFSERYPLARKPLSAADGTVFATGSQLHGAYPWVAHDGTEIVYTATIAGTPGVNQARRGAVSVIGRWTGNQARHIDGPINMDRTTTVRLISSSPGAKPTFWTPYRGVSGVPIPYTAPRPIFPLITGTQHDYDEVSFEDFVDQDYVLALRMNEVVTPAGDYDPTRTPDTSGNSNTGLLQGARFPQEYDGTDAIEGVVGQAIYFGDGDEVRVPAPSSFAATTNTLSVQLFAKRLVDLNQNGQNNWHYLVNKPGSFDVVLEVTGQAHVHIITSQGVLASNPVGNLPVGQWTSVAFTYDAGTGELRTYVGGVLADDQTFGPGAILPSATDFLVGPGGQTPSEPFVASGQAIVMIDEVLVSRVLRSDLEIARGAFVDLPAPVFANDSVGSLPQGLDPTQLRIPASNPVTQAAAQLGQLLFFDPRLSGGQSTSCSTCHDPTKALTDGLPKAVGFGGQTLTRNAPRVANRALSTLQFLDGRAGSLEDQALAPIQNPNEMNSSLANAIAFLTASPDYSAAFQNAFGAGPSAATIGQAIASFERTILAGGSPYDQYLAGQGGLGASEQNGLQLFNGKARCVTCHSGSNFTDESFHDTSNTMEIDDGREAVTGRRMLRAAFKTPSLRDVALTAPYLHDGSVATLEDLIALYNQGGISTLDRDTNLRPLQLTAQEQSDLAAFLRALTSSTPSVSAPSLPATPAGYTFPATPPQAAAPTPPPIPGASATVFDESYYLSTYLDVAAAVQSGEFSSGYAHYLAFGAHEKRNPNTLFDEVYYLATYPDVAAAVAKGEFLSGWVHYCQFGQKEGRSTHP